MVIDDIIFLLLQYARHAREPVYGFINLHNSINVNSGIHYTLKSSKVRTLSLEYSFFETIS